MPGAAAGRAVRSGWPIFFAFIIPAGIYTTYNTLGQGQRMDDARTRWNAQKAHNEAWLSAHGAQLLEQEPKQEH